MAYVRAQAREQGLLPPYRVLAMSLGGMVATAWAQCHAHEVERLVLVNTSMRPWCGMTQRLRPAAWPALLRLALAWRKPRSVERIVHALTCARTDTLDADLAAWLAWRAHAPVSTVNAGRQLWAAARYRAAPYAPACPTLLLSSAADRLVDPHCSARIARQWGAAHIRHPWAGHDLPHDDARWLIATLLPWLTAQD
jgi:pimeloyl-ACP methyl ester carboxylesterase